MNGAEKRLTVRFELEVLVQVLARRARYRRGEQRRYPEQPQHRPLMIHLVIVMPRCAFFFHVVSSGTAIGVNPSRDKQGRGRTHRSVNHPSDQLVILGGASPPFVPRSRLRARPARPKRALASLRQRYLHPLTLPPSA